jgi:dGTPase
MQIQDLGLGTYCSIEGQIAALADDIAYNNHDIDDGFRAGYIAVNELEAVPMASRMLAAVRARYGDLADAPLVYEMNRRMIAAMVEDVLAETRARIDKAKPGSIEDVRRLRAPLAGFSAGMTAEIAELRRFLFAKVYRHPAILEKMANAQAMLLALYEHFSAHPEEMHLEAASSSSDPDGRQRAAGDFVAGMTDMFAIKTYTKIFGEAGG